LDGDAEVEAELEEQLVQHIGLGAIGLDVLHGVEERLAKVIAVRLPCTDVAGIELEDTEAEVARVRRVLVLDLLRGAAEALLGQLGDVARLADFIAKACTSLLLSIGRIKGLRELHYHKGPFALIFCIKLHYCVPCCAAATKK